MFKNILKALPLKIAASIGVAVLSIFGLGACGGSASAEPVTNGTYVYASDNFSMVGEVVDDTIQIDLKLGEDTGLYWAGTFQKGLANGAVFTSKANVEQLKTSAFGSLDTAKEFKIVDGKITFPFTILGTTRTIELEKNSSVTN